jgi:hypothetical protein
MEPVLAATVAAMAAGAAPAAAALAVAAATGAGDDAAAAVAVVAAWAAAGASAGAAIGTLAHATGAERHRWLVAAACAAADAHICQGPSPSLALLGTVTQRVWIYCVGLKQWVKHGALAACA